MSLANQRLSLFSRFCTVGASNTLIDFVAFFLFIGIGFPYMISQILSFSAGMINSFLLNRKWTFGMSQKIKMSEIFRFIMINLLALALTNVLLTIFFEINSLPLFISKVLATSGGLIVTFAGSRLWVFQRDEKLQES
ncbi:GtrA family protein [Niallia sp. Krafla_26]|uniref:GtrA family protein n=1 Tax=Niallia sp. Krafla_26 TaxID=3064703 RepID=UPI003D16F4CE